MNWGRCPQLVQETNMVASVGTEQGPSLLASCLRKGIRQGSSLGGQGEGPPDL